MKHRQDAKECNFVTKKNYLKFTSVKHINYVTLHFLKSFFSFFISMFLSSEVVSKNVSL